MYLKLKIWSGSVETHLDFQHSFSHISFLQVDIFT